MTSSPSRDVSGGNVLSSHTRKTTNGVGALLRLAAVTAGKTNTARGAFYRRLAARIGKPKAVTAAARKITELFQNAVRLGMQYVDPGEEQVQLVGGEADQAEVELAADSTGSSSVRSSRSQPPFSASWLSARM